jgi:hypothetical protein
MDLDDIYLNLEEAIVTNNRDILSEVYARLDRDQDPEHVLLYLLNQCMRLIGWTQKCPILTDLAYRMYIKYDFRYNSPYIPNLWNIDILLNGKSIYKNPYYADI